MPNITRQRIRIAADAGRFDSPLDILRQAPLAIWRCSDIQLEIGVHQNGALADINNLASITIEVRPAGRDGDAPASSTEPSFAQTLSSTSFNAGLTSTDWNDGTAQHATLAFTAAETAVDKGDYWITIFTLTTDNPGQRIVLAAGAITIHEQGAGADIEPQPATETFYTASESDSRFALGSDLDKSEPLSSPTGFDWAFSDFSIYRSRDEYHVGWETVDRGVQGLRPAWFDSLNGGTVYYVGFDGHSSSNNGLSPNLSKPGPGDIFSTYSDYDVLVVGDNYLNRNQGWGGNASSGKISRSCTIIGLGNATLSHEWPHTSGSWTQDASNPVYHASRSVVDNVWDKRYRDAEGDYGQLVEAADIATCRNTPGSFYMDTGNLVGNGANRVYIHALDGRLPDEDITIFLTEYNGYILGGTGTIYIENLRFYGGNTAFNVLSDSGDRPRVVFVNCEFKYAAGNGLSVLGASEVICVNCIAARNGLDGFNYHKNGSDAAPDVLELNCRSYNNGWQYNGTNNASTMHDGGRIIRVDGSYSQSTGPVLADVNANTQSWNLGVSATSSKANSSSQNSAFMADDTSTLWLDGCRAADCENFICATNGASVLLKRMQAERITQSNSTVGSY